MFPVRSSNEIRASDNFERYIDPGQGDGLRQQEPNRRFRNMVR